MAIAQRALQAKLLTRGARIAAYTAFDGEVDLRPLITLARRMGCIVYVPRIVDKLSRRMDFIPASPREMRKSGARLSNPRITLGVRLLPHQLDIVFVPLIAFDANGWRLGFGGGFYDRNFSFLNGSRRIKPRLVGIAYAFQEVLSSEPESWDIPMHMIITDRALIRCRAPKVA